MGRRQTGLLRVARRGFTTFREPDGLGRTVGRVFVSRAGEPIAISEGWRVSRFNGQSFHTVRANVPESARRFGPTDQSVVEDRAGDWWFATGVGLVRFSGVKRIEDLATIAPRLYTSRDGLAQDDIRSLFEDASGGIWIAGLIPGREVLTRWDRASGQFRRYSDADGLPAFNSPTSFYEDPRGVLWIAFRDGGIARHEAGHFRCSPNQNGLPRGGIGAAIADHTGRLWCANRSPRVVSHRRPGRRAPAAGLCRDTEGAAWGVGGTLRRRFLRQHFRRDPAGRHAD